MATAVESAPRIVKAHAAASLGAAAAFNLEDLQRACDAHLDEVRERSRRLVVEAASEADRVRAEAAEAGRRDGYRDGIKKAEAEIASRVEQLAGERLAEGLETVLPAVRRLADDLRLARDRWTARWEVEAVRLAVAIAEKLLRRTLAAEPAAADALLADTLRLAAAAPRLTVRLSRVDFDRLGGSLNALRDAVGRLGEVELTPDDILTPGDCTVETRHGGVDGRIDTQLERIVGELLGESAESRPVGRR